MSATIIAASAGAVVEQIGAYAGYAAIIGLGILALLYFTQAREVKRLREWAGRAPERAVELEERVQADAQKRVVAQPIGAASAAGQQAAAATAAVYASVGAQPPGASPPPGSLARTPPATPNPGAPAPGAVPPAPGAAAPGPQPLPPTASAGTQTQIPTPTPTPSPSGRPMVTATPSPTATTPAAAAARAAAESRTLPAANGSTSQDTAESAAARPEPLPSPPSQFSDDDDDGGGFGLSPVRVGMIVGGAVTAVLVAVVLMVSLTGEDDPAPPGNQIGDTPAAEGPSEPADSPPDSGSGGDASSSSTLTAAERRATNVAVLNGTTRTGLARAVGNKIQGDGFTIGDVDTNSDQSVPATTVSYSPDNRPAALAVAKVVGIDSGSVQPSDANSTVAADGDVVVIVGSDQIE